ncbi:TraX family protein [Candidatus Enterococcus clewellii]|uniref:TraX protein n=1 Tax=Candidatus Enterococcus clewellii TaxID=1834193 RepID=A0A242K464_9ENTE|nr:TraX family protein [Enterococcus sp. 9E7_DIV0242]OTP13590.1 hypothetical protein A5888_003068 [Enterococcus sp. 9E7_DIV0242]
MHAQIENGKRGFTTFDLKVLGVVFMFIDHIHEMFSIMGAPAWLDWFGRPVATLFFFISVEGFSHTSNKEKYLKRLWLGFFLMNIGNYLVQRFFSLGDVGLMNNIFSDLFIAVLSMYGIELISKGYKEKAYGKLFKGILCLILPVLISIILIYALTNGTMALFTLSYIFPSTMFSENSIMIYLATAMYVFRKNRTVQCLAIAVVAGLFASRDVSSLLTWNTQWMMIFAIIPIALYNGERGKSMKQFFYVFYPAHIWLLYILASIIYTHFI